MRSEIPKPPIKDRTSRDLKREMERMKADEAITAGLDAACAFTILNWAAHEISAASHRPNRDSEVACAIRAHARKVGQIARMMTFCTDTHQLKKHLGEQFPTLPTDDLFSSVEEAIEILLAQWDAPHTGVPE
ncbi:hypothetical protein HYR99_21730 [Candidatus Poribacteria bacterium]|nr:hypothetical protein [Candidatus Poribacteria bacterium]